MHITTAHGGGGRATQELIDSVFAPLKNPLLSRHEDAAVLPLSGEVAISTDSFVVQPLFFRGGDIGRLAVCGTVNDLLMRGAVPQALTAGFILEEGLDVDALRRIVDSMAKTAAEAGVCVIAADTKVIEGKGGLFINTTGFGTVRKDGISAYNAQIGDAVLLSGPVGDHAACIASHRMGIENAIASDVAPLSHPVNALVESGARIHALRDATRGGLAAVLNEIATASGVGIDLEETAVPVSDETRALCALLGLDPLTMANEGKLVAFVPAEDAQTALRALRSIPQSAQAVQIGLVRPEPGVTLHTRLGGKRLLPLPLGEGLPRIC